MQNIGSFDACTALSAVPFVILHNYGISEDFLGLDHYYGIYVPPVLNFVSVLGLVLVFWATCKLTNSRLAKK